MHIVPDGLTLEDAFIAIYILTAIADGEAAIIFNLAERVGGFRKLLKLASSPIKKKTNNASDRKTNA
jgi:hypothetical protein